MVRVDVYHHIITDAVDKKLDNIQTSLDNLTKLVQREAIQMAAIDDKIAALQQKVNDEGDVITSSETLLGNLSQMLKDALAGGVSQATLDAVDAIANQVDAKKSELAAAVAANTPAA